MNAPVPGTAEDVAERIVEFRECRRRRAVLQFSPQYEEMERFAQG